MLPSNADQPLPNDLPPNVAPGWAEMLAGVAAGCIRSVLRLLGFLLDADDAIEAGEQ